MRFAMVAVFILAVVSACFAQDPAQETSSGRPDTVRGQKTYSLDRNLVLGQQANSRTFAADPFKGHIVTGDAAKSDATCFTMRAYMFSPGRVGQAPRRTGYTTCTPSNALQMRQAKQPRARYLPQ